MTITMRPYQQRAIDGTYHAWDEGYKVVCNVLSTGAGKTRCKARVTRIEREADRVSLLMAHRHELIGQISMALAAEGIMHNLICSKTSLRYISTAHTETFGTSFYSPRVKNVYVSSIDSLSNEDVEYFKKIGAHLTWTTDEGHHVLRDNKWGKPCSVFDDAGARGLIVTATPSRADGKGLGRHADGLIDKMIVGPSMRELITMGYLTDYRIFCPPSDLRLDQVEVSKSTGDFQKNQLQDAVKKSRLVGDVVEQYIKIAPGKRGVTFTVDVSDAEEVAQRFRDYGVPAAALSAKNSAAERNKLIRQFKEGEILQIVNCDLLGEGFDLPAIEAVSFARPTQSYGLYVQQFGRALRILEGKEKALIIDHVGNVIRHDLPDKPVEWTLDRRDRRAKSDSGAEKLTVCVSCFQPFPARNSICPHCGERVRAASEPRTLEQVEGDLTELTPEILAQMRGEADRVMESPDVVKNRFLAAGAPQIAAAGAAKQHRLRMEAQIVLRDVMQRYGDFYMGTLGCGLREAQITFWQQFGTDVLSAQALGRADAEALTDRVRDHLLQMGVAA